MNFFRRETSEHTNDTVPISFITSSYGMPYLFFFSEKYSHTIKITAWKKMKNHTQFYFKKKSGFEVQEDRQSTRFLGSENSLVATMRNT